MKKNYLLAVALALTAMVGCTDESFVGDQGLKEANESVGAISFNLTTPAITRAEVGGSAAATALNNQFIIWGEKNETDGTAATATNLVFKNYIVRWANNSAYTTTSNTKNWEYVGYIYDDDSSFDPVTTNYSTNITPNTKTTGAVVQTIKYWDYGADSYTFTAVSALPADISNGKVVITKNTSGSTVYDKGYDIEVKSDASIDNIFIADRNQPTKGTGTDRNASNAYGGNVKMTFRNFMSKIRFGIYENIPGYKVKITNVDYKSTSSTTTNKFGVDGKFLVPGDNTAYTVSYYSANNKAKVAVKGSTPNSSAYLETTKSTETLADCPILHTAPTEISTSPATPTYDRTGGTYTTILPFPSNDTNMKVQLDFTLTSEDTGETISVVDATAEIPAAYCQWLPNYAYTYILKLNDNTNGQIGGVTGLYPITFDAIEITDETGSAEYITTLSEPSITTFGVKGTTYSTGQSDYASGTSVYATVEDNHALATLTKSSNIWLYTVTGTNITEADVAERLIEEPTMNKAQITAAKVSYTDITTDRLTIQNTVPAEDDVTTNKTLGENKVATFTTAASTKYAIVYQKTAPTYVWGTGSTYANQEALTAAKDAAVDGKLYTDDQCKTEASYTWSSVETVYYTANAAKYASNDLFTAAGNVFAAPGSVATPAASRTDENTPYYKPIKVKSMGTVVVKVVNCPAAE